jgi:hypothetical protein
MIRLGSLAGYLFDGPRLLVGWTPPEDTAAVYAVLYRPDPESKPDRYAVIYVGHSEDLAQEGFPFKHPKASCWVARAGTRWQVHIATFEVPGGGPAHRQAITTELTAVYLPHCNTQKYDNAWKDEWIGRTSLTEGGQQGGQLL